MRREIEFAAEDGTRLGAFLHVPDDGGPAPLIVMSHGFSGVKERIDHYAAAFAADGFCVLLHDHRGFGASDGKLRLEVDPFVQMADWRDAITFGLDLPEVDGTAGVGIWGSSFAGGMAIVLGATDPRISCVVAQIPNVSGPRNVPRMFDAAARARLRDAFADDRRARLKGGEPATIPVYTTDPKALSALPPAVDQAFIDLGKQRADVA